MGPGRPINKGLGTILGVAAVPPRRSGLASLLAPDPPYPTPTLQSGVGSLASAPKCVYVIRRFRVLLSNLTITDLQLADARTMREGVTACLNPPLLRSLVGDRQRHSDRLLGQGHPRRATAGRRSAFPATCRRLLAI